MVVQKNKKFFLYIFPLKIVLNPFGVHYGYKVIIIGGASYYHHTQQASI